MADEIQSAQDIESKLAKRFESAESGEQEPPEPQADAQEDTADTAQEAEAPDETAGESGTPEVAEIEIDGQTYQVPAVLKDAFTRQSDYTRGKQELADARRQIELQEQAYRLAENERAFRQTIEQPLRDLAILDARTNQLLANWQQLSIEEKQELLYLDKQREQVNKTIAHKQQEFEQGRTRSLEELRTKTLEFAKTSIPGWSEDLSRGITSSLKADGLSDEEIKAIVDPRHLKIAWKAHMYDKLRSAKKPVVKAPVVAKPGPSAKPMPQQKKDDLSLRKAQKAEKDPARRAKIIEDRLTRLMS